ncbi:hypothetical protein DIPPA_09472 [Diplonema papillatum]|nr:hypothetical protein DIPPA_09472 [Diplonema papillatum]
MSQPQWSQPQWDTNPPPSAPALDGPPAAIPTAPTEGLDATCTPAPLPPPQASSNMIAVPGAPPQAVPTSSQVKMMAAVAGACTEDPAQRQAAALVAENSDAAVKAARYAADHPEHVTKAMDTAKSVKEGTKKAGGVKTMAGCAAVGAAAGLIVSGPIIAVAGAGALCYAATRDGPVGDVAQATGKTACSAFDKAKEVNKEYHITDKVSTAASSATAKAKEVNSEYHVTDKVSSAASSVAGKVKDFDKEYNVSGKAAGLAVSGMKKMQHMLKPSKPDGGE